MAETTINLNSGIHAELLGPSEMVSNTSIVLDPISKSYSNYAPLKEYEISVAEFIGISDPVILHNGKNSRLSVAGSGRIVLELLIRDEKGNTDTDILTINVR